MNRYMRSVPCDIIKIYIIKKMMNMIIYMKMKNMSDVMGFVFLHIQPI